MINIGDFITKYNNELIKYCNQIPLECIITNSTDYLSLDAELEDVYFPVRVTPAIRIENENVALGEHDVDELMKKIGKLLEELSEEASSEQANLTNNDVPKLSLDKSKRPGIRHTIVAGPGAGKSMLMYALALAYAKNDMEFLERNYKYLNLPTDCFPVFMMAKKIDTIKNENNNFIDTAISISISESFSNFDSNDKELLRAIIQEKVLSGEAIFLLDGYDEILTNEKQDAFKKQLNLFLREYPKANIIITSRQGCFTDDNSVDDNDEKTNFQYFEIPELTDTEIEDYCHRWYKIYYNNDEEKVKSFHNIVEQLNNNQYSYLEKRKRVLLDLNHLLIISRNNRSLPENKYELYSNLYEFYLTWYTNKYITSDKYNGALKRILDLFLQYIAIYFVKNKMLVCSKSDLTKIIEQGQDDLYASLSINIQTEVIILELCRTGIFGYFEGINDDSSSYTYGFNRHRQMLEYLAAKAILEQNTDSEYSELYPFEILSKKYKENSWRETILFAAYADGRLCSKIIKDVIKKSELLESDNATYSSLTDELIMNADRVDTDVIRQYCSCFLVNSISEDQIVMFNNLFDNNPNRMKLFYNCIQENFKNSVLEGNTKYGLAYAAINMVDVKLKTSDVDFNNLLEELLNKEDSISISIALNILMIITWCKYIKARKVEKETILGTLSQNFKLSAMVLYKVRMLCKNIDAPYRYDLACVIKDCVLAGFCDVSNFFGPVMKERYVKNLENGCDLKYSETILSLSILMQQKKIPTSKKLKHTYLDRLRDEINNKDYSSIIFTFNLCVVIDAFENKYDALNEAFTIQNIYRASGASEGKIWLNKHPIIININSNTNQYNIVVTDDSNVLRWFFKNMGGDDYLLKNNLFLLMREKKVHKVYVVNDEKREASELNKKQLLFSDDKKTDPLSFINYALLLADEKSDIIEFYKTGLNYLQNKIGFHNLDNSIKFWKDKAENNVHESVVVFLWLYNLFGEKIVPLVITSEKDRKILYNVSCLLTDKYSVFKEVFISSFNLGVEVKNQIDDNSQTFTVIGDNGEEITCEILFTFESDETKKNYIVYTDDTFDEEGNVRVFASIYDPESPEMNLLPIETDKEWKIIETILEEIQNEANNEE